MPVSAFPAWNVITRQKCASISGSITTGTRPFLKIRPVSFYNRNPNSPGAQLVGSQYLLPYDVLGHCSSYLETNIVDVGYAGLDTLYAVINDSGTTIPLALPNTALVESNYFNNINYRSGFKFHITAAPANSTLNPYQSVTLKPLPATGGAITSAIWSDPANLSCTSCVPAVFTAPYRGDTVATKKVMAYSRYGCYDSAYAVIHIPPADDYSISITGTECAAGGDSVYVSFTICNSFPNSDIPANIKVSFYDANAVTGSATMLGNVFVNPAASADSCISYTQLIKQSPSGSIYAVVNDRGAAIPVVLPDGDGILEKNYGNNVNSIVYTQEPLNIVPTDTTIFRDDPILLSFSTPMIAPTNPIWQAGAGYDLSCTNCMSTMLVAHDSAVINLELTSRYGCTVKASSKVNVFPPDMTVEIIDSKCFTNDSTIVRFRICMNNRYHKVFEHIPVSFYDGSAGGRQLYPLFYTPGLVPDSCHIFTHVIATPAAEKLVAMVNDKGTDAAHTRVYSETDYNNNAHILPVTPFSVAFNPSVIEILRPGNTTLLPQVAGGTGTQYKWLWPDKLSCYDCASPVASTISTTVYQVKVTNEYTCTDTAAITIKTFTNTTINIPTAFSPDGNGQNDIFYVIGTRDIQQVKDFTVFNRWGQQVFHAANTPANDKQFGWDGKLNGKPAAPGAYVYNITLEMIKGMKESYKGVIMLVR